MCSGHVGGLVGRKVCRAFADVALRFPCGSCVLYRLSVNDFEATIQLHPKYYETILNKAMEQLEATMSTNTSCEVALQPLRSLRSRVGTKLLPTSCASHPYRAATHRAHRDQPYHPRFRATPLSPSLHAHPPTGPPSRLSPPAYSTDVSPPAPPIFGRRACSTWARGAS